MILPRPNPPFEWKQTPAGAALVCQVLEPHARHIFTTRLWALGSLDASERATGWNDVAGALEVEPNRLFRIQQVHGANAVVQRAGRPPESSDQADVIVSADSTAAIAVRTADCVPLLVADVRTGSVAAAHAGWRGLVLRVPSVTIQALVKELGSRRSDLVVAIGPSIGSCCYEVGFDVRERFKGAGFSEAELSGWFSRERSRSTANPSLPALSSGTRPDHWFLDVWAATRDQLIAEGISRTQIHVAELCTASHAGAFCSYRRDGSGAGRLAAAIRKM